MSTIGDKLKDLRLKNKLTQEEVGKKINVSKQTLYKYESGIITNIPSDKIEVLAEIYNTTPAYLMGWDEPNQKNLTQGVKVPVLGRVVAGIPLEAVTEILDYEELHPNVAKTGEFFALQIKGNSMYPRICDGDVVIVKRQNTVESGDIAIVLINGDEATVKKVKLDENGIMLIAFNADVYEPHFYSNDEIKTLPIEILGKVVELRGKF